MQPPGGRISAIHRAARAAELVAKKYDGIARRGPSRPRTAAEIVRLLMEMATRNTGWGCTLLRRRAQERRVRSRQKHDQEDLEGTRHLGTTEEWCRAWR